jgi:glutamate-1-semialdehyde 2,1-aminomutase
MPTSDKSSALFCEAKKFIPGGVNSPVRACLKVGVEPRFIARAKGSRITDCDGNEYVDFVCSWGPAILGHAFKDAVDAVTCAAAEGLTFGAPTEREVEMAKILCEIVPCIEMSRMVSSGTEAVMSAIRTARAWTGRELVLKFEGCYHGHSDSMLVKAGSGALTAGVPDSAGVPDGVTSSTVVARYNNMDDVHRIFKAVGSDIAAVIVEPVAANNGVVLPADGFLKGLREITSKYGSVLIFDEVITGLRLALGGAQEYYGIVPDLVTMGKIVGGGMPAAVFGGRAEIMKVLSPEGPAYQAGTLSGNPLATAAGLATIKALRKDKDFYGKLEKKTFRLAEGLRGVFGEKAKISQVASLIGVSFADGPEVYAAWYRHLLNDGFYIAPSMYEAMFVSAAHTNEEIDSFIESTRRFAASHEI